MMSSLSSFWAEVQKDFLLLNKKTYAYCSQWQQTICVWIWHWCDWEYQEENNLLCCTYSCTNICSKLGRIYEKQTGTHSTLAKYKILTYHFICTHGIYSLWPIILPYFYLPLLNIHVRTHIFSLCLCEEWIYYGGVQWKEFKRCWFTCYCKGCEIERQTDDFQMLV